MINNTGGCVPCSDGNCISCNSLDQCSSCTFPYLLHFVSCVSECPVNYTSNGTDCFYDPIPPTNNETNNNNDTDTTNETLN